MTSPLPHQAPAVPFQQLDPFSDFRRTCCPRLTRPAPEEQLPRWNAHADVPVDQVWATVSFEATNLKPDVMTALCVFAEVAVGSLPEPVRQARKLP